MNKIKVIDLLNMISKGEEVPKKFKYKGEIYIYRTYTFEDGDVMTGYGFEDGGWLNIWRDNLNDEIEIIEEKKIPKKLKCKYTSQIGKIELAKTINEIIDYLEENK